MTTRFYLHVGTHKTGTTFMQNNVFPKFDGIEYVHPWSQIDALLRLDDDKRYLISNERFAGLRGASLEDVDDSIAALSRMFPGAKTLISFRPHDGYIVSSYKQYLHQGSTIPMNEYFDIDGNRGVVRREQFLYRPRIESITKHFGEPPFVFFLEEIQNDLSALLADLERFLSAKGPPIDQIDRSVRNLGVSYNQAQVLRQLNRWHRSDLNPAGRFNLNTKLLRTLKLDPRRFSQYWLRFLPKGPPFLSPAQKSSIGDFYRDDWEYVQRCAKKRLPAVVHGETAAS